MDIIPDNTDPKQNSMESYKENKRKSKRHRRTKSSSGYELLEYTSKVADKKINDSNPNFIELSDFISNDVTKNAITAVNNNTEEKNVIIDT